MVVSALVALTLWQQQGWSLYLKVDGASGSGTLQIDSGLARTVVYRGSPLEGVSEIRIGDKVAKPEVVDHKAQPDHDGLLGLDLLASFVLLKDGRSVKLLTAGEFVRWRERSIRSRVIPMRRDTNGLFLVECDWDGWKVGTILDTGATVSAVDSAVAKIMEARWPRKDTTILSRLTQEEEVDVISMGSVAFGDLAFPPANIVAIRWQPPGAVLRSPFILGMDYLTRFDWAMDFPNRKFWFLSNRSASQTECQGRIPPTASPTTGSTRGSARWTRAERRPSCEMGLGLPRP